MQTQPSILTRCSEAVRPLPVALAHELARARVTDQHRQETLGRLFRALRPVDQFKCRAELMECRAAQRGEVLAEVVE